MQPASVPQPTFPEKVGKYELLLPIGTGGMATVYLARTTDAAGNERHVALKLVHAHLRGDKESKLHLLEEAKLAALIKHPNVIQVIEIDEDPFGVFLVMDYVAGESLSGLLRLAKEAHLTTPWRLVARILNDALLGLHAAHELRDANGRPLGLVHRDFSPQNILVSMTGETRLGDFGVAKAADRAVRTKTGLTKGKIAYMSPEQARGHAVDRRCDVWAAGVLAWELIARQRLYRSDDDVATLLSIVTEQPPRLSHVLPQIPKALDLAVSSALQPILDSRCPTAEEFRVRLAAAWESADGMAEPSELAQFMAKVVGPELEGRNQRISHVKSSRQQPALRSESQSVPPPALSLVDTRAEVPSAPSFGELRAATAAALIRSPNELTHGGVANDGAVSGTGSYTEDSVTVQAPSTLALRAKLQQAPTFVAHPAEMTETSAVVPTFRAPTRRSRNLVGAIAVAGTVILVAWATGLTRSGDGLESAEESPRSRQENTARSASNLGTHEPSSTFAAAPPPNAVGSAPSILDPSSAGAGDAANGSAGPNGAAHRGADGPAAGSIDPGNAERRTSSPDSRAQDPKAQDPDALGGRSSSRGNKAGRPRTTSSRPKESGGNAPVANSPTKHTGPQKPKLATSPYAGSKSGE